MNIFGRYFRLTSFGESHGKALGAVVDGCPAGVSFSLPLLKKHLTRRRPGRFDWQTSRKESDDPQILSGVFEGKTLGTPIAIVVENKNQRSQDYQNLKTRKGHADDLWKIKYGRHDYRGGGRASGRETVSRVIGGSVALMFLKEKLKEYQVLSFVNQVGPYVLRDYKLEDLWSQDIEKYDCCFPHLDQSQKIKEMLVQAKKEGESYGGSAKVYIKGVCPALGQPVFEKLKSSLTQALMGIGGVCGISIGSSLEDIGKPGQEFHQNPENYGGVRGGLSTGEQICLCVYFKPTSSLGKVAIEGRHDPCIIPRALPVLESMVHLVIADHLLARKLDTLS